MATSTVDRTHSPAAPPRREDRGPAAAGRATRALAGGRRRLPGFLVSLLVAAVATAVAARTPFGSAPVFAIVLGVVVGSTLGPRPILRPGISASSSLLLRGAVVVLGAELPLVTVLTQGIRSLPVIVVTLGGCLLVAATLGRRLGVANPLRTLIGVGTGICGASAIAAVTPAIEADELDVGYAVATIFLFNVLAVLTFPPLGHALGMSQHSFGVFSGTAINDLSSVVAAGDVFGEAALRTGVVVKLTRTLMIVPIAAVLAARHQRATGAHVEGGHDISRALANVPRFLLGFLALAAIASTGLIPAGWTPTIGEVATAMITVALAAVGLSIDVAELRRTGPRPIVLGASLWVTVSVLSLTMQLIGLAG